VPSTHGYGRGHGKLILCGEHAVVYGYPAIALAVDRGMWVQLTPTEGFTGRVDGGPCDDRLQAVFDAILPPEGVGVSIESDLPIGRGMGSSAALAVALIRARADLLDQTLDPTAIFDEAFAVERVFHGNPSGLDHAVSSRGGALLYRRGPPARFEPLPCPPWSLVVLDSEEVGNTAELVAGVATRRPAIDPTLERIGQLVLEAVQVLDDPERLGPLLTENHALLRAIGVSNDRLDALVELALACGAHGAKLAGAGGGGVVLALITDPQPLLRAAAERGIPAFLCQPTE
jgi:mevalonate kinase